MPAPVADRGGFRVDTNGEAEIKRWVFPTIGAGLRELAYSLDEPRHFLKLCGKAEDLRSALPQNWSLHPPGYFMQASAAHPDRPLPAGYRIEVRRDGMVAEVRIVSETGLLAASGYAVETTDAFVYDRIITEPAHYRKGLGSIMMAALQRTKQRHRTPELLVATEEGRALYGTLGWRTISPFSTASIPLPEYPPSGPASFAAPIGQS